MQQHSTPASGRAQFISARKLKPGAVYYSVVMSSDDSHSFLLACPPEIHFEIVYHLNGMSDRNALKRFSQTLKLYRSRALPVLFTGLWLNQEAVAAFSDGGALSWVRPFVLDIR
ncbi:hypothetical protein TWF569_006021 [Orbilia oligospora]|nr:hypothetical protein TWF569_006021 [Orbilia oligospora]